MRTKLKQSGFLFSKSIRISPHVPSLSIRKSMPVSPAAPLAAPCLQPLALDRSGVKKVAEGGGASEARATLVEDGSSEARASRSHEAAQIMCKAL